MTETNVTQLPAADETQMTIVDWANETFGAADDMTIVAARCCEESSELVSAYFSAGAECAEAIVDEIADVFVVACQVAARYNVRMVFHDDLRPQNHRVLVPQVLNLTAVMLAATVDEGIHITPHLRTLEKVLGSLAVSVGAENLQTLVNAKMQINRNREWTVDGNGVGQHVE